MASYGFTIYRDRVREGAPTGDDSSRAARVRTLRAGEARADGDYVLYWMQMYLRRSENAALDEAVRRANLLGLPLLVYQGLNPDYPQANDRIHTFILELENTMAPELPVPENRFEDLGGPNDEGLAELVDACPIDHEVPPSRRYGGGRRHALRRLSEFIDRRLDEAGARPRPGRYSSDRVAC